MIHPSNISVWKEKMCEQIMEQHMGELEERYLYYKCQKHLIITVTCDMHMHIYGQVYLIKYA